MIEMFKEEHLWECPFCGRMTIRVLHFPRTARPVKTSWGGSKPWMQVSKEVVIIQSGCSNCGKSREEVEKELLH